MAPDQAKFLFEFLLPQLKTEHAATMKVFCAVPPEKGDFRPAARSMSAFDLARHIALCEIWFLDAIVEQGFKDMAPLPASVKTCHEVAAWYSDNFKLRVEQLEQLSKDALANVLDFQGLREYPAVAYLNIALRHSVHHRGQLAAYLRPMDAKVPAIYVESGDEPYPPVDGSPATDQPPPLF